MHDFFTEMKTICRCYQPFSTSGKLDSVSTKRMKFMCACFIGGTKK
jgi:hypothetical protein